MIMINLSKSYNYFSINHAIIKKFNINSRFGLSLNTHTPINVGFIMVTIQREFGDWVDPSAPKIYYQSIHDGSLVLTDSHDGSLVLRDSHNSS